MSRLLEYEKLHNIRDLGGERTADGRRIVSGKLIRCGHLAEISEKDRQGLSGLVETIVDFRTDGERAEKPDADISGAEYHHIPIMDSLTAGITREKEADQDVFFRLALKPVEAKHYMCEMYRQFAESGFAVSQYARFIRLLLKKRNKAVLWHCTAGKDRAGVAAVIIEELLGVPRENIVADYLTTNTYLKADIRFLTDFVKKQAGTDSSLADEALRYLFGAERDYINSFYNAVETRYTNFNRFIKSGLGLTDQEIDSLKKEFLENQSGNTLTCNGR